MYCADNPVMHFDPTGMDLLSWSIQKYYEKTGIWLKPAPNPIRDFFVGAWNGFVGFLEGAWNGFVGFLEGTWNAIVDFVSDPGGFVLDAWNSFTSDPLGFAYHMFDMVNPYEYYKAYEAGGWEGVGQKYGGHLGEVAIGLAEIGTARLVGHVSARIFPRNATKLIGSFNSNPSVWNFRRSLTELARGSYKGGISTYAIYKHFWTGEMIGTHIIIRNGRVLHYHFSFPPFKK
jgi:hypothetical protein